MAARKTRLVPWRLAKDHQTFMAITPDGESIELEVFNGHRAGPILSPERKTVNVELIPWLVAKDGRRTFLVIERKRTRELVEIPGARKHLHSKKG